MKYTDSELLNNTKGGLMKGCDMIVTECALQTQRVCQMRIIDTSAWSIRDPRCLFGGSSPGALSHMSDAPEALHAALDRLGKICDR